MVMTHLPSTMRLQAVPKYCPTPGFERRDREKFTHSRGPPERSFSERSLPGLATCLT